MAHYCVFNVIIEGTCVRGTRWWELPSTRRSKRLFRLLFFVEIRCDPFQPCIFLFTGRVSGCTRAESLFHNSWFFTIAAAVRMSSCSDGAKMRSTSVSASRRASCALRMSLDWTLSRQVGGLRAGDGAPGGGLGMLSHDSPGGGPTPWGHTV